MYSEKILNRFNEPKFAGRFTGTVSGEAKNEYGDFVKISLEINKEKIEKARFNAFGCVLRVVYSDIFCELITGRSIEEASLVSQNEVEKLAGEIPARKKGLISLAPLAFADAIKKYRRIQEKQRLAVIEARKAKKNPE